MTPEDETQTPANPDTENQTNPGADEEARDEATAEKVEKGKATSKNLDGGKNAKDALGVKKNAVGPNRDESGPDNSPTLNDVQGDRDENIADARDEGLRNGRAERPQR